MSEVNSSYINDLKMEQEQCSILIKHISRLYENVRKIDEKEANIIEIHWRGLQRKQEIVEAKLEGAKHTARGFGELLRLNEFEENFGPQMPIDDEPPF